MRGSTWIVIPAYNESRNIATVLRKVRNYATNIIVVDDGSRDRTSAVARKQGVTVLRHIINLGKGAALKTGCEYALLQGAERIVVMDADGQHDPAEISRFLSGLRSADVVLGYRQLNRRMPLIFRCGNGFINLVTFLLFRIRIRDTQCGFRAFTRKAYGKLRWNAPDYSMESEMVANVGKFQLRYVEVPIRTIYADRYKGTTILDGVRIVFDMVLWRLRG